MKNEVISDKHKPVLLRETMEILSPAPGKIYIDATVGQAGHAEEILKKGAKVIGLDYDSIAIEYIRKHLNEYPDRFLLFNENYTVIDEILNSINIDKVDGILFDLGLSSLQINSPIRGFSFRFDSPLDMRADLSSDVTACDVVNKAKKDDLIDIFKEYGEERKAKKIAEYICNQRKRKAIESTKDLADIVFKAYGGRRGRIHPATRVFQALRIYLNKELENLKSVIEDVPSHLSSGGKIVFISYHSLEDRIVKVGLKELSSKGGVKILTKKPIVPELEEVKANPRARSAKLRAAEKIM